ncbi:MAG TPA: hypothetical protein VM260_24400, partial [Pirellula sp.]|nr:hypothetical protein [Pirellula sp.]
FRIFIRRHLWYLVDMGKESIAPISRAEAEVARRRLAWLNQSLPELVVWFEMRKALQAHTRGEPLGPESSKAREPSARAIRHNELAAEARSERKQEKTRIPRRNLRGDE